MAPAELSDGSVDDFSAGSTDAGAYVARTAGGEVMLAPAAAAEFTGTELPAGWSITPCREGGAGHLGDGHIALDGARVGCETVFRGPRRVVDFAATFAARPDQHAGFGLDYVHVPWVMFSTKWGRRLYARTHHVFVEDRKIPGSWFGASHRYRIEWNLLDIVFSIDGEPASYLLVPVPGYMRALAANERLGGTPLKVEWMRVSPYARSGSFTSRVGDAGAVVEWLGATWQAEEPPPTTLALSVRTGNAAHPDRTWSGWRPLAGQGAAVERRARYLQYRADMSTSDDGFTPVLREVRFHYRPTEG